MKRFCRTPPRAGRHKPRAGADELGPRDLYAAARCSHAGQSDGDLGRSVPRAAHRTGASRARSRSQGRRANRRRSRQRPRNRPPAKPVAQAPQGIGRRAEPDRVLGARGLDRGARKIGLRALPALAGENSRAQKGSGRAGRVRRRDVQRAARRVRALCAGRGNRPSLCPAQRATRTASRTNHRHRTVPSAGRTRPRIPH